MAPLPAFAHLLAARPADAAARVMDAAFAIGYLTQTIRDKWNRESELTRHLSAAARFPVPPLPQSHEVAVAGTEPRKLS